MLDEARDKVTSKLAGRPAHEQLQALEREGIRTSIANLRTFPCIQTLEARGRIALHAAHFDIANGTLSVLNEGTDEFVAL